MATITPETLAQAAEQGDGIAHLSPAQAWAAWKLDMPPARLQRPLARHTLLLLANIDRKARRAFQRAATTPDAMIGAAFDDRHPPYLRLPVQAELRHGMAECFPGLSPASRDADGNALYSLTDLATALGTTEAEIVDHAKHEGMADMITTGPVRPIH
ncbi:hypothetical protein ACGTN6_14970 [Halomonas sp. THAF12]|uniref:hypothetical protein n=1 Tax=Halomonas sp. B23F22_10 TaxID=3459515 RepID=UPI00373FB2EE